MVKQLICRGTDEPFPYAVAFEIIAYFKRFLPIFPISLNFQLFIFFSLSLYFHLHNVLKKRLRNSFSLNISELNVAVLVQYP